MDIKKKIVLSAKEKFFTDGFQKTRVDEIAAELRISKKTIYKHFSSKEEIADAVMGNMREQIAGDIDRITAKDSSAVDKLYQFTKVLSEISLRVNDKWLNDMRLYLPKTWEEIDRFRSKVLYKNFKLIFEQGKKEGLINEGSNEIMLQILIGSIQRIINPDFILNNSYSLKTAIDELILILMNGMLTSKGSRQLAKVNRKK